MNRIHNLIVLLLCISVLGFFANWAQNDYGDIIIEYCFLGVGLLFNYKAQQEIKNQPYHKIIFSITY